MRPYVRLLLVLAAVIVAAIAWKRLRGEPAPVFNDERWPTGEPWPPIEQPASAPIAADTAASASWIAPNESGGCPPSHPVKAKLDSGIYHEPGALNYERTRADRCYVDGATAAADGMRKSKR